MGGPSGDILGWQKTGGGMPLRFLRIFAFTTAFAAAVFRQAPSQEERLAPDLTSAHPILPIGASAPDFSLPGIDGKTHKLSDYSARPYLMVMFICNHCPTSQLLKEGSRAW
jgi:hypothetical protein